ncbi:MAG TPA: hypothetical protein PKJ63_02495 [Cyclobacteriaceae bacterium]|nr:hypothetical protein [Cyclobacteriaceae bacterium]
MKQFLSIEKFKGEIRGEFTALWIATDPNGQLYLTYDLEYTEDLQPDLETTQWKAIDNTIYSLIADELRNIYHTKLNKGPK